jgi:hypothetical protein
LIIDKNVERIREFAFYACSGLTSIELNGIQSSVGYKL